VRPVLGENLVDVGLGRWLAARIGEVEQTIGILPSIAVFVDGDELIDPLVASTRELLAERSIPIVGCKEGRVVGDAREVRVFDIHHIKGLEFEAVFFILQREFLTYFIAFYMWGSLAWQHTWG
jgi:hypothetical protein